MIPIPKKSPLVLTACAGAWLSHPTTIVPRTARWWVSAANREGSGSPTAPARILPRARYFPAAARRCWQRRCDATVHAARSSVPSTSRVARCYDCGVSSFTTARPVACTTSPSSAPTPHAPHAAAALICRQSSKSVLTAGASGTAGACSRRRHDRNSNSLRV